MLQVQYTITVFMKMIDENYLSSYNKRNISIDRGTQKPFEKMLDKSFEFPVAKGTDTKNKAVIDFVLAADDIIKMGYEDFVGLTLALQLMNLDNSSIKQAMLASNIAESYNITMDTTTFQPTIHFVATNADPSAKQDFYYLVMRELEKTVKNGLDTEMVRSSLRSLEFQEALGNSGNSGLNAMVTSSLLDTLAIDPFVDLNEVQKVIVDKLNGKILEKLIDKYIIHNSLSALTVTKPVEGLLEKNQKAKQDSLNEIKASMSKAEINKLIEKTADFNAWNSKETPKEVLESLKAVSLKDINVEIKEREIKEIEFTK